MLQLSALFFLGVLYVYSAVCRLAEGKVRQKVLLKCPQSAGELCMTICHDKSREGFGLGRLPL